MSYQVDCTGRVNGKHHFKLCSTPRSMGFGSYVECDSKAIARIRGMSTQMQLFDFFLWPFSLRESSAEH